MLRTLPCVLATLAAAFAIVAFSPSSRGPVVPEADALRIGTRVFGKECSDGLPPSCQQCSDKKCITTCFGDHSCDMDRDEDGRVNNCTWKQNVCKPLDAGFARWTGVVAR